MKKTYKIEVDCAACALKMEEAAKKVEGVKDATAVTPSVLICDWMIMFDKVMIIDCTPAGTPTRPSTT